MRPFGSSIEGAFLSVSAICAAVWAGREVFDDMLRRLRDDEVVQLHAGDVTLMTPEQVEDGFVDENGFRMGTMTWIG